MSVVDFRIAFRRFAQRALADPGLELEIGLDVNISPPMFRRLVKSLRQEVGEPLDTLQLDIMRDTVTRLEYVGRDHIEAALAAGSRGPSIGAGTVRPSRVLVKRREMAPVSHEEYEYTVKLKREMDGEGTAAAGGAPGATQSAAFRLKRRFSFRVGSCNVDCTVVQSRSEGAPATHSLPFTYEVEVELVDAQSGTAPEAVVHEMSDLAMRCLRVMLGTSQPPTRQERTKVMAALAEAAGSSALHRLVGPQPVTLVRRHVRIDPDHGADRSDLDTVWRGGYTVTDKADGVRCQLIVVGTSAYTVDTSLVVRRVLDGLPPPADGAWLDGELITGTKGKVKARLNMFMAFDMYHDGAGDVTHLPLIGQAGKLVDSSRLGRLDKLVRALSRARSLDGFEVLAKKFTMVDASGCATRDTLENARMVQDYETDGLIFTPAFLPVGGRFEGDAPRVGGAWPQALKWKPPSANTVDFLVQPAARPDGRGSSDANVSVVPGGEGSRPVPCHVFDLFASYVPRNWETLDVSKYIQFGRKAFPSIDAQARRFDASTSGDIDTSRMYVPLDEMGRAACADGDPVYGGMIVECAYDPPVGWKPLRLRPEKTAKYVQSGVSNAANDWGTAMNIWGSVSEPVTDSMIMRLSDTPAVAPGTLADQLDAYYARRDFTRDRSALKGMADFHGRVIKARLYADAAKACGAAHSPSLFEIGCGKGGDLGRWSDIGFTPIVGVDLFIDNIVNAKDGIYARLDGRYHAAFANKTVAFVCLSGETRMRPPLDEVRFAASTSPHGDVISTLWDATKRPLTSTAFSPLRGLALRGFDVVSCQFAIHYLFENDLTLDRFVQNVAFLLRPGSVFIGTCFDGERLARELESAPGGVIRGLAGKHRAWEISKRYDGKFDTGTGFAVDVFVETINQTVREYLVSRRLLEARLKGVGLELMYIEPFSSMFPDPKTPAMADHEKVFSAKNMMFAFRRTT